MEFPGAIYHITSRGNAKQTVFLDNRDRDNWIEILSTVVERFHYFCHAYCLMDNHYHLIIETPEGNLSKGMRQLNGVYTQAFNRRHERIGHVFQGRYKAVIVEKESHLLSLCRYVVLNPVRAGIVNKPERWVWSSYRATIGVAKRPAFLKTEWILSQFDGKRSEAVEKYKRFVTEGIVNESPWENLRGQIFLGTETFIESLKGESGKRGKSKEIPKTQRYAGRPSLEELFKKEGIKDKDDAIYMAYIEHGYRMREIAEYLGVHYATVSRSVGRMEQQRKSNLKK